MTASLGVLKLAIGILIDVNSFEVLEINVVDVGLVLLLESAAFKQVI